LQLDTAALGPSGLQQPTALLCPFLRLKLRQICAQQRWCTIIAETTQTQYCNKTTTCSVVPAAEQSSSFGNLIQDELQLLGGTSPVVFGCETLETGEIFSQEADGIMGLGNSEVSVINQVCQSAILSV